MDLTLLGPDGEPVGEIRKQWSGLLQEAFTDADNFGVALPAELPSTSKALVLAAVILTLSLLRGQRAPEPAGGAARDDGSDCRRGPLGPDIRITSASVNTQARHCFIVIRALPCQCQWPRDAKPFASSCGESTAHFEKKTAPACCPDSMLDPSCCLLPMQLLCTKYVRVPP